MSATASKRGRPPFVPTAEQRNLVTAMRGNGTQVRVIARIISVPYSTLRTAFRDELKNGTSEMGARIALTFAQAAMTDWHAAEKWLRMRGGPEWQPAERRFVGGIADAPPIPLDVNAKVTIYLPDNGRRNVKPEGDADAGPADNQP
jgi:hypothetical protein